MTRDRLRCAATCERQIANESSNCHREHYPAIVSHEEEPDNNISGCQHLKLIKLYAHYEERVEDLYSIEEGLDNLARLLDRLLRPPWSE